MLTTVDSKQRQRRAVVGVGTRDYPRRTELVRPGAP